MFLVVSQTVKWFIMLYKLHVVPYRVDKQTNTTNSGCKVEIAVVLIFIEHEHSSPCSEFLYSIVL